MSPQNRFYGIDLIRFSAALMVLIFHFLYVNAPTDFGGTAIAWFGWIGVEVFFVISGLVIANSASGLSAIEFLKGRALRLYPAAWVCASISLIVGLFGGFYGFVPPAAASLSPDSLAFLLPRYARSMTLFPNGPWIDDVYWSLGVEVGFYTMIFALLAAGAFAFVNVFAAALTITSTLYVWFIGLVFVHILPQSPLSHFATRHEHALDVLLLTRHGAFFALGIWLWLTTKRPLKRWEAICAAVSGTTCVGEIVLRSYDFMPTGFGAWNSAWPVVVWSALVACLYFASRQTAVIPTPIANTFYAIGLLTYPLYLIHNSLGVFAMKMMIDVGVWNWPAFLLAAAIAIGVSSVVCDLERTIRRALRQIGRLLPFLYGRVAPQDPFRWHSWTIYRPFKHDGRLIFGSTWRRRSATGWEYEPRKETQEEYDARQY